MKIRNRLVAIPTGAVVAITSAAIAEQWVCPTTSISAESDDNGRVVQTLGQPIIGRATIGGLSGSPLLELHAGALACYRVVLVADFDRDGVVGLGDFNLLAECLTGPVPLAPSPDCEGEDFHGADLDHDDDVDLLDYADFARQFE
jgi:hypothetical protein